MHLIFNHLISNNYAVSLLKLKSSNSFLCLNYGGRNRELRLLDTLWLLHNIFCEKRYFNFLWESQYTLFSIFLLGLSFRDCMYRLYRIGELNKRNYNLNAAYPFWSGRDYNKVHVTVVFLDFRVSNIRVSNRTLIYNVCPKSALTWPSRYSRHIHLCRFYKSRINRYQPARRLSKLLS